MDAGAFASRPIVNGTAARRIEEGQYHEAMARAGRLLAKRSLTQGELRRKLRGCGFTPAVVERVVVRLRDLDRLRADGTLLEAR